MASRHSIQCPSSGSSTTALGVELNSRIGHFMLEGRYYYGLSDIYNNSKTDIFARSNNGTITVKLTYLFDVVKTKKQ